MTPIRFVATVAVAVAALVPSAQVTAATWSWDYNAAGIAAAGTFTTTDAPDSNGFYTITAIGGLRNGVAITGLEAAGSAIPGNDPYAVDNLVSIAGAQLTWDGFGYALADGSWANAFSDGSSAWEYLSVPPYPEGAGQEVAVAFSAAPVPEPAAGVLVLLGVAGSLARAARGACAERDDHGPRPIDMGLFFRQGSRELSGQSLDASLTAARATPTRHDQPAGSMRRMPATGEPRGPTGALARWRPNPPSGALAIVNAVTERDTTTHRRRKKDERVSNCFVANP